MMYGSVCSGIEAATVAWHGLGWKASFYSEVAPFPRAVLTHRYPETPLHGDFTTIQAGDYAAIDLLVGGTPCQSFSIAGLRGGLDDDRGNLALEYLRLADRLHPRWLVWENVHGVLSSVSHASPDPCPPPSPLDMGCDGAEVETEEEYSSEELHAFQCFLAGLSELGYGFAYRVLDAQYFGVPQRRRRVFVVGYLGDWRRAAAVLLERHSLQGHPPPRREAGQAVAGTLEARASTGGFDPGAHGAASGYLQPVGIDGGSHVGHALTASQTASQTATGRLDPSAQTFIASAVAFNPQAGGKQTSIGYDRDSNTTGTLSVGQQPGVAFATQERSAVRRLTPRECERLQGFPDDYTLVPHRGKPAADGPRYKALGNSMAVPVMAWIGKRIAAAEAIAKHR